MNKRLKYNLQSIGIYIFVSYMLLLPLAFLNIGFYYINIPISLMSGWLFSMLNSIYIELRRLNGEKFTQFDDISDEKTDDTNKMIKS